MTRIKGSISNDIIYDHYENNKWFDVKYFGAIGDGITDDTAAIQAAVDALSQANGGIVKLFAGRYLITDEINISKHSVVISGGGNRHGRAAVSADGGTYIVLGGNITGSIFRFIQDSNNQNIEGCGVENIGFIGDNRSYTVEAAVHAEYCIRFRLDNCDFHQIAGRAIYTQACTFGHFTRFSIYQCGDTNKPALDVNSIDGSNPTQASVFSMGNLEVNYLASYLNIDTNSEANKFSELGFEADSVIGDTQKNFITGAGDRNQFSAIHMNDNAGSDWRFVITGKRNVVSNIVSAGVHGAGDIQIDGNYNILTSIETVGGSESYYTIQIAANKVYNRVSSVVTHLLGGIQIASGATHNSVMGFTHFTGVLKTIDDSGSENSFIDIKSDALTGTGPAIDIGGDNCEIIGGIIINTATITKGINMAGDRFRIRDVLFRSLSNATALDISGDFGDFQGCYFSSVSIPVVDTGALTSAANNRGDAETVTGTVTLHNWGSSLLNSNGGAVTATLPNGAIPGQIKIIGMSDASNSSTVSVTQHETSNPEVFTFNTITDCLVLVWDSIQNDWLTIKNRDVAT